MVKLKRFASSFGRMVLRDTAPWTSSKTLIIMRMMIIMILIMIRGVVKVVIMMTMRLVVVFWPNEHGWIWIYGYGYNKKSYLGFCPFETCHLVKASCTSSSITSKIFLDIKIFRC